MKRSNLRIGIIVLFASLLMMFNAYPVMCQDQPVEFDVLNEVVFQGDPVEVAYAVNWIVDITEDDLLQLRRVDNDSVVSAIGTQGAPSGEVSLDTSNALLEYETEVELKVVYVLGGEAGAVIATAEETVLVVEAPPEPRPSVEVPSLEAPTIQAAINLVDDGGTVSIKPGVDEINEPIMVQGKTVIIQGAGSSRNPKTGKVTQLVAPLPTEVADPEVATGIFNFIGTGGIIKDIDMSGGQSAVVGRNYNGASENLIVEDIDISNTGRGILWKASSDLAIKDVSIYDCLHNGLSIVSPGQSGDLTHIQIVDLYIGDVENVGAYFWSSIVIVNNMEVKSAKGGGLVAINCTVTIEDCLFMSNNRFGVGLFWSEAIINDSGIYSTQRYNGLWGDGVQAWISDVELGMVPGNYILNSERAAVANYGSKVDTGDNRIECNYYNHIAARIEKDFFEPGVPTATRDYKYIWHEGGPVDFNPDGCGCPKTGEEMKACMYPEWVDLLPHAPVVPEE